MKPRQIFSGEASAHRDNSKRQQRQQTLAPHSDSDASVDHGGDADSSVTREFLDGDEFDTLLQEQAAKSHGREYGKGVCECTGEVIRPIRPAFVMW